MGHRMPSDLHNFWGGNCWCGTDHQEAYDRKHLERILQIHKRLETRVNEADGTLHFGQFGLNGEIHEWLTKEYVLKIIEEEFGNSASL